MPTIRKDLKSQEFVFRTRLITINGCDWSIGKFLILTTGGGMPGSMPRGLSDLELSTIGLI